MTSWLTANTTGTRCGTLSAPAVASCATGEEANLSLVSNSSMSPFSSCDTARIVNSKDCERHVHYQWKAGEWRVVALWRRGRAPGLADLAARSPERRCCG